MRTAARKSFGLEQKPMLGKIDNFVVGNLSSTDPSSHPRAPDMSGARRVGNGREQVMQSKKLCLKFLATALAALVFVLILVVSASVDAGNKNKNKGGGGGGGGAAGVATLRDVLPRREERGGGCVTPGGPKPAKNMQQQQQRSQKKQQQVDRPRGQDKKQVNKLLENPKQGKPQVDKRQAGPKGDGGKQQAGPKGDGGKKFGDYLKDKDRNRPDGGKTADDDKKGGKDRDRPGLGDYLKDKDRGTTRR